MPLATYPSESPRCPGPRSPGHLQAEERCVRQQAFVGHLLGVGHGSGPRHVMRQVMKAENCRLLPMPGEAGREKSAQKPPSERARTKAAHSGDLTARAGMGWARSHWPPGEARPGCSRGGHCPLLCLVCHLPVGLIILGCGEQLSSQGHTGCEWRIRMRLRMPSSLESPPWASFLGPL